MKKLLNKMFFSRVIKKGRLLAFVTFAIAVMTLGIQVVGANDDKCSSNQSGFLSRLISHVFAEDCTGTTKTATGTFSLGALANGIAAGDDYSLALQGDGTALSWGAARYGHLGFYLPPSEINLGGYDDGITTPYPVYGLNDTKEIDAGQMYSVALKNDGKIWVWGNRYDENRWTSYPGNWIPDPPHYLSDIRIKAISTNGNRVLAVLKSGGMGEGKVMAFGQPDCIGGELTFDDRLQFYPAGSEQCVDSVNPGVFETYVSDPSDPSGLLSNVIDVSAGKSHSMALKADGTVVVWGNNYHGLLGNGTTGGVFQPAVNPYLTDVKAIAAGTNHSLALKNDGTVWAWGENYHSQLGNFASAYATTPVQVAGVDSATAIAVGNNHSLALKNDGTVLSWGKNSYGQLGDGTLIGKRNPSQVASLDNIVEISSRSDHNLARKDNGEVWAWGANGMGQLGLGRIGVGETTPQLVGNFSEPILSVTLDAEPSSGISPLNVTLTAKTTTTHAEKIKYSFWWNCNEDSKVPSEVITACGDPSDPLRGQVFTDETVLEKSVSHVYDEADIYYPKILIEQGTLTAERKTEVNSISSSEGARLIASPRQGPDPLNAVLKAYATRGPIASSAVDRNINYFIWWDCVSDSTDLDSLITSCGTPSDPAKGSTATSPGAEYDFRFQYNTYGNMEPKVYHPKLLVLRGEDPPATNSTTVTVNPATAYLYVNIETGAVWQNRAPASIPIIATINSYGGPGASPGDAITYTFYCDRSDTGTDIKPGYAARFEGRTETSMSVTCDYEYGGQYAPKVIVERGPASPAQASTFINLYREPDRYSCETGECYMVPDEEGHIYTSPIHIQPSFYSVYRFGSWIQMTVAATTFIPTVPVNFHIWKNCNYSHSDIVGAAPPEDLGLYFTVSDLCGPPDFSGPGKETDSLLGWEYSIGDAAAFQVPMFKYSDGTHHPLVVAEQGDPEGSPFYPPAFAWPGYAKDIICQPYRSGCGAINDPGGGGGGGGGSITEYLLTVNKEGTGGGRVFGGSGGINCGGWCSASYASAESVTLTAEPWIGATFAGWGGACSGTDLTCTLSMTGNKTVTAIFNESGGGGGPTEYNLTVNKDGTGTGAVTGGPINCGDVCNANIASGTSVNLTATPDSGFMFSGWRGACSGTGSCNVVMNANRTVTATFNPIPFSVSLTANPNNSLPVTSTLTATVTTPNLSEPIDYWFWWDCNYDFSAVENAIAVCGDPTNNPGIGTVMLGMHTTSTSTIHTYYNVPGKASYAPKIIAKQENNYATKRALVGGLNLNSKDFSVSLNSTTGTSLSDPSDISMTAETEGYTGNTADKIDYTVYCTTSRRGKIELKGTTTSDITLGNACHYKKAGRYKAKVIAKRGDKTATATTKIIVGDYKLKWWEKAIDRITDGANRSIYYIKQIPSKF